MRCMVIRCAHSLPRSPPKYWFTMSFISSLGDLPFSSWVRVLSASIFAKLSAAVDISESLRLLSRKYCSPAEELPASFSVFWSGSPST